MYFPFRWAWDDFDEEQLIISSIPITGGHGGTQAGGKKVPHPDWTQALLQREMAEQWSKEDYLRRQRQRLIRMESRRSKAEIFGKMQKSAALAVLLSEV